jgi:hypothetical protein
VKFFASLASPSAKRLLSKNLRFFEAPFLAPFQNPKGFEVRRRRSEAHPCLLSKNRRFFEKGVREKKEGFFAKGLRFLREAQAKAPKNVSALLFEERTERTSFERDAALFEEDTVFEENALLLAALRAREGFCNRTSKEV